MARVKAEGEAEDYSRRLTVAQEQIAEYALERQLEVTQLLEQAEHLGSALQQFNSSGGSNSEQLGSVGQRAEVSSLDCCPAEGHLYMMQCTV